MTLDTEAGNFTVAVEIDLQGVESPSAAARVILDKLEGYSVRVTRISREYVPIQRVGAD